MQRIFDRADRSGQSGFSLPELLISMTIMLIIIGGAMTAMTNAMHANETAQLVTGMNHNLRTGMDLMIRDMLQVGSGMPTGHFVLIPSGTGSTRINMPGPPGTTFKSAAADTDLNAINPGSGLGHVVNGQASDVITTLTADSTFNDIALVARASDGTSITVNTGVNISTGPDRVIPGQLIMLEKSGYAVLLQVTSIDGPTRRIFFAASDSLGLNQHNAPAGSTTALKNTAPATDLAPVSPATVLNTTATRVRMVSYYIDTTISAHPRLVRRVNNGSPTSFNNSSGNVVAFDIDRLTISYDLADGISNPTGVRFTATDLSGATGGKCAPSPCSVNQIRKVNITMGARSRLEFSVTGNFFHNTLTTQVSFRGMSFVNEYTGT